MKQKYFCLLIVLLLISNFGYSQRWKKQRFQVAYGIGSATFLGELGGANDVGSNFVRDLDVASTRPSTSILLRYRLTQKIALRGSFSLGYVSGADSLTEEYFRNQRNLSFRSPILELSGQLEYNIVKEKDARRYSLRGVRGASAFSPNIFLFVGLGGFYFNPQAEYQGHWVNLQPLGTEGQNIEDIPTRKPYSRFSICIPYGIGMRVPINRSFSIGLEFGVRKTFTDYLDDVSTTYVDNNFLRQYGDKVADLADRSGLPYPGYTQRGDPTDKDSYAFMFVSLYYKIKVGRRSLPSF
jgi:hypothetical protein